MIDYQCWICPKCSDDHSLRAECSPKIDKPFSPASDDHSHIASEFRKLEGRLADLEKENRRLSDSITLISSARDLLKREVAWQTGMLERAKEVIANYAPMNSEFHPATKWLADLEVGQKGEEEDNA